MSHNPQAVVSLLAIFIVKLLVVRTEGGSPQLIFKQTTSSSSLINNLETLSLDDESVRSTIPVTPGITYLEGVSYDARTRQIYWASKGSIYRQRSDGTGQEIIVNSTESITICGLAYDWVADNIYYANYRQYTYENHIGVCSLSSRACAIIVDKVYPLHIALHPQSRALYWTSDDGYIYKASMDGSSPKNITERLSSPSGITVDHQASRLYWATYGAIQSSDLDGANVKTILPDGIASITGVALHGDLVYWVEGLSEVKVGSKLNASTVVAPLLTGQCIDDIKILSPDNQPPLTEGNTCGSHPCSHICVLSTASYSCLCPSGFRLGSDGKTCKDLDAKIVYWSERGSTVEIQTLSLNSSVRTTIPISQGGRPGGLSHNPETAQIYWSFNYKNVIYRMEIDGTGKQTVFTTGGVSVRGIASDWNANNIYYTDNVLNHIGVCSLNTDSCSVLIKEGPNEPTDITLDPSRSTIYWADSGSKSIMKAYMNGSSAAVVVSADGQPYALSMDQQSGYLYWVDSLTYEIRYLLVFNSGNQGTLVSLFSGVVPFGVDVNRGRVYWTEHYSNKTSVIRWINSENYSQGRLQSSDSGEIWTNLQAIASSGYA